MDLYTLAARVKTPYNLEEAVKLAPEGGLFMEFGVYTGLSLCKIAYTIPKNTLFGFDCWEGLPEDLCGEKDGVKFVHDAKGSFKGYPAAMPENCILVNGLFADSIPKFIEYYPQPVSFMHIDCDLYSSTKTVLDAFADKFLDGAVLAFDEIMPYAEHVWHLHEYKAFTEFLENNPQYEVECISCTDPHAAFRLYRR